MNSKKKKIIVVFFAILVPLYFVIFNNKEDDISNIFILKNLSEVKFIIIKKDAKTISLKKKDTNNWYINNKYEVNKTALKKLKQALSETKVNKPVPKELIDSITNILNTKAKTISIYNENNEIIKTLHISEYDELNKVTYANTDKEKTPYIISIPGLEKDLNQRYNLYSLYWINPEIFTYKPHEITEIEVVYSDKEKKSYKIEVKKDNPKVLSLNDEKYLQNVNINKVGSYFSYFMNINFSDFNTLNDAKSDSLKAAKPDFTIIVNDIYNVSKKVELYKIKVSDNPTKYDFNKLYAIINKEDIVIVKYFDFDLILKDISYFKN